MSDLPPGWEWVTLQDLASTEERAITDGPFGSHLKSSHYTTAGARVIRLQNIGDGEFIDEESYISLGHFERLRTHEAREGDLVIASLGENPPRACLIPQLTTQAIVKADCIRVRLHPKVDAKWVLYALLAPPTKSHLAIRIRGVSRPRLGLSEIRSIPLPLPPLAEQHRIVATLEHHLSRLEFGTDLLRSSVRRLNSFRSQLLARAVDGSLSPSSRYSADGLFNDILRARKSLAPKRKAPAHLFHFPGYRLPSNWVMASLDALSYDAGYGTSTKCDYQGSGEPVLRIPNIQRGEIDVSDLKRAVDPSVDLGGLHVGPGDLLFVRTNGSRDLIGRVAVVRSVMKASFASYLIRFRPIPNGVHPDWVRVVVSSPRWRRYLEERAASSAGQYNLNMQVLAPMPIPVPPREEQEAILARLEEHTSGAEALETTLGEAQRRSEALRRSLLGRAFSGRLVPQDSNDEPVSKLLARIGAERTKRDATDRLRPSTARVRNSTLRQETLL